MGSIVFDGRPADHRGGIRIEIQANTIGILEEAVLNQRRLIGIDQIQIVFVAVFYDAML